MFLIIVSAFLKLYWYKNFINLDVYIWDTDKQTLSINEKIYKHELYSDIPELDKPIGKAFHESAKYRVWSIEGESIEEYIAIQGFMWPANKYKRVK